MDGGSWAACSTPHTTAPLAGRPADVRRARDRCGRERRRDAGELGVAARHDTADRDHERPRRERPPDDRPHLRPERSGCEPVRHRVRRVPVLGRRREHLGHGARVVGYDHGPRRPLRPPRRRDRQRRQRNAGRRGRGSPRRQHAARHGARRPGREPAGRRDDAAAPRATRARASRTSASRSAPTACGSWTAIGSDNSSPYEFVFDDELVAGRPLLLPHRRHGRRRKRDAGRGNRPTANRQHAADRDDERPRREPPRRRQPQLRRRRPARTRPSRPVCRSSCTRR